MAKRGKKWNNWYSATVILIRAFGIFWQAALFIKRSKPFQIWRQESVSNSFPLSTSTKNIAEWGSAASSPVISCNLHHCIQMQIPCTHWSGETVVPGWKDYRNEMSRYMLLSGAETAVWMGRDLTLLPFLDPVLTRVYSDPIRSDQPGGTAVCAWI